MINIHFIHSKWLYMYPPVRGRYSLLRSKTFDYRIEVKGGGSDAQRQPAPEPEKEQLVPGAETEPTAGDGAEDLLPSTDGSGSS